MYYRGSLRRALADLMYHCSPDMLVDLYSPLHHAEEAEARAEEAQEEAAMAEDMTAKSITESKQQIETLCRQLKDTRRQLGNTIKEGRQLKERLLANSDELLATRMATKEARKAWEEEKIHIFERERKVMTSYKESMGFCCNL
ncbi:hypothetical protein B296_00037792 [Ensete ventricosum]|uniref:Uncharacterized protein n=1 Tax=Ensete ventricosum TaxID=4639 RepID=A0A426Y595_ENSVE|nr:hypothetical protein B296_00037792 [Ensete ventricosum]